MPRAARALVETLIAAGVEHLFTLSGNQILSVYDAAIDRPLTLSALYGARMEDSPVVLLSGASPRAERGLGSFQEIDQAAAARPVTKAAWTADDADRLGDDIARALTLAQSGRPGPVHVGLPGDVLDTDIAHARAASVVLSAPVAASEAQLKPAVDVLCAAKRPVIIAGPGMARGRRWAAVHALSHATGMPAVPSESPRGLNDPWLHGGNTCLAEADAVLLLGKALDFSLRFGRAAAWAPGCHFVQVTAEPAPTPDGVIAIVADPVAVAQQLAVATPVAATSGWAEHVGRIRAATPPAWDGLRRGTTLPMHPLAVCAAVQPWLDRGATLVADGGEFGQWAQAGLEARIARPDAPVFALLGDGTFGFHALEIDTAVRYGVPFVAVVGNDARWNAEHQLQLKHYGAERTIACELLPTRYDRVAAALGGHGEHVEHARDLAAALERAVASGKPAVVNVVIDGVAAPTFGRAAGAH